MWALKAQDSQWKDPRPQQDNQPNNAIRLKPRTYVTEVRMYQIFFPSRAVLLEIAEVSWPHKILQKSFLHSLFLLALLQHSVVVGWTAANLSVHLQILSCLYQTISKLSNQHSHPLREPHTSNDWDRLHLQTMISSRKGWESDTAKIMADKPLFIVSPHTQSFWKQLLVLDGLWNADKSPQVSSEQNRGGRNWFDWYLLHSILARCHQ